jgi:hypothetical protein
LICRMSWGSKGNFELKEAAAPPYATTQRRPRRGPDAIDGGAVNQLLKSLSSGKSARYVLWEPEVGDRLRRPYRGGTRYFITTEASEV